MILYFSKNINITVQNRSVTGEKTTKSYLSETKNVLDARDGVVVTTFASLQEHSVEFVCSPCARVASLHVLWLPPTARRHAPLVNWLL